MILRLLTAVAMVFLLQSVSFAAATDTFTETETGTVTYTWTETPSATASATFTYTPTQAGADTGTFTNTATPGDTFTITPTVTVTPAGTPSTADCLYYTVDRSSVPAMVFMKELTLSINVGSCAFCTVYVDGVPVPNTYNPSTGDCIFTASGNNIHIFRWDYAGGGTNAVAKMALLGGKKWAYSFTFDDGRPSVNSIALPVFEQYGYTAGIALNTNQMQPVSNGWVMSWQTADNLRAHNWSFFDHNYSHAAVACENISTETLPVKSAIEARWPGYLCTHFVYPYCNTSYWECLRDSGLMLSAENCPGWYNYADSIPSNRFILNRNAFTGSGTPMSTYNGWADNAASDSRPRWLISFTHNVEAGSTTPGTYDTNEAMLGAHMAYIYNTYGAGGLDNVWVAPADRVMQYILTREYAVVSFAASGQCNGITPTVTPVLIAREEGAIAYPNPANNLIKVSYSDDKGADKTEISLYTLSSELVAKRQYEVSPHNVYTIDASRCAGGIYIVVSRLYSGGKEVFKKAMPVCVIKR